MAGLLDMLNTDDGALGLYLMAAGSAKPQRTSLGEGLLGGLQMVQQRRQQQEDRAAQAEERKQRAAMQAMQMQQMQAAMAQQKKQQLRQDAMDALPGQFMSPGMAPSSMDNRDVGQPGEMPIPKQQFDLPGYANALFKHDPARAIQLQQMLQKDDTPMVLGDGGMLVTKAGKVIAANPKESADTGDYKNFMKVKAEGYPGSYNEFLREQANLKAPKTTNNSIVNMGQKGFDNTLKLRGDFRSEPIYKAHQEMQSAYSQIQQSLKQASPAGDLAGATKIMKLLDPGSVVRESELGMAMAASGLLDRVQNYAQNIMAGTKLTPTQRADFQKLADALYGESVKQYNGKRAEYQGIAERNQLSVPDVLGAPSAAPTNRVVNFGDMK